MKFALVGALGAIVDFGLLNLFHGILKWPLLISNVLSVSAAIINNFTLNRLWTFREARGERKLGQFSKFVLVSVVGLLLNTAIVVGLDALLARWLEGPWRYNLAKAVAVGVVLLWNYGANRFWTFNIRDDLRG
jgi:putative flippase GtrA